MHGTSFRMQISGDGGQSWQIHIDRKWTNGGKKTKNNGIAHKTGSHGERFHQCFVRFPYRFRISGFAWEDGAIGLAKSAQDR